MSSFKTNVLFLKGHSIPIREEKDSEPLETESKDVLKWDFPQWPTMPSEEMTVVWPLLAYKSMNPSDSEIIFCNLATNEPQKVVDIHPYRFVQFVDMGMFSERHYNKGAQN